MMVRSKMTMIDEVEDDGEVEEVEGKLLHFLSGWPVEKTGRRC